MGRSGIWFFGCAVSAAVLVAAGFVHLRSPRLLKRAIAEHRILPIVVRPAVVVGTVVAEVVLGAGLLLILVVSSPPLILGVVGIGTMMLYLTFATYAYILHSRKSDVPCGCGPSRTPANPALISRNVVLAVPPAIVGFSQTQPPLPADSPLQWIIVLAAVLGIGMLLWLLPMALYVPSSESQQKPTAIGRSLVDAPPRTHAL